jgi:hypothetical protein
MSDVTANLRSQLDRSRSRYNDRANAVKPTPGTGVVVGMSGGLYQVRAIDGNLYTCRSISTGSIEIDPNGQGKPVALHITNQGIPTISVMPV